MFGNVVRSPWRRAISATALTFVLASCSENTTATTLQNEVTTSTVESDSEPATPPEGRYTTLPYTVDWTDCPDAIGENTHIEFGPEGEWAHADSNGNDITGEGIMYTAPHFGTGPDAEAKGREHFCASGD